MLYFSGIANQMETDTADEAVNFKFSFFFVDLHCVSVKLYSDGCSHSPVNSRVKINVCLQTI